MASKQQWTCKLDGQSQPDKTLIGGKAASLARMRALGLPVPPAFVINTHACLDYLRQGEMPAGLRTQINDGVAWLESQTGRTLGSKTAPLLLSVRSGAAISMPGMMDTVLNLGISDVTEKALADECNDPTFARDTHRRFYQFYSQIVLKASPPELPGDANPQQWRELINQAAPKPLPESIDEQLESAVRAVFDSWNTRRAKRYRKHNNISDDLGTAVTIQAMVFGNLDDNSGTGVLFSRNPLTGEPKPYGEYLPRAQGEDVVSGKFSPHPLDTLQDAHADVHAQLLEAASLLERENGDVQDIEFTVQQSQLYLLQSRNAKRAPAAAVRIAVDMHNEGIISVEQALRRVTATQARSLLSPRLAKGASQAGTQLAKGQGACPGVASGEVVTDADTAEQHAAGDKPVVLARATTSPEDLHGMLAAVAVITEQGGTTSHAAVVSRALGRPCVVGCGSNSVTALQGQTVTVDGDTGVVYAGSLKVVIPDEREDERLAQLLAWAREHSPLKVYSPEQAPAAEITDLDATDGGADADKLSQILAGLNAAKGGAIASDEGVAAALAARLEFIVAEPTLPPLLAAIHVKNT